MATSDDSGTYIGDATTSIPTDTAGRYKGAAEIRKVKSQLAATFPNFVGAAVSATEAELNYLDITTLGTAAASKALVADGSAEIDAGAITFTDLGTVTTADINGGTWQGTIDGTWTASGQTCTHLGTVSDADFTKLTIGGSAELTAVDTDLSSVAATDTTLASAKAIKAAIDALFGAKSIGANGYITFGGLTLQWGIHTHTADTEAILFNTAFSTACYAVVVTCHESTAFNSNVTAYDYTTTQFTCYNDIGAAGSDTTWIAIGV